MKEEIKKNLIKLIDLKSIITIIVVIGMVIFTGLGIIGPDLFIGTAGSVFTFYFTKKKGSVDNGNTKENHADE